MRGQYGENVFRSEPKVTLGEDRLFPPFLVIRAPFGIGTLRVMARTAPVPLAAITEYGLPP